jgi:hypothetical protein
MRPSCPPFEEFCAKDVIEITKKGKKGERQMDISRIFLSARSKRKETRLLYLRAAAGSTLNINPMLLLDAFAAESGLKADWLRIVRTAILDQNLQEFSYIIENFLLLSKFGCAIIIKHVMNVVSCNDLCPVREREPTKSDSPLP